jgi:hypothetical protein
MTLSDDHVARLARTSKKAALISAVGAAVVFASIGLGVLLLLQKNQELDQQITSKQDVVRQLNVQTAAARAAQDKIAAATREAQDALDQMNLALRQAKTERADAQDLRDQIKAASDANLCSALVKMTDDHLDSSPPADSSPLAGSSSPHGTPRADPRAQARAEWRASQAALLKKDTRAAEQHLQSAIAADPTYAAPYNSLGRLKADRGDLQGAERLYKEAHTRSATYAPALVNLTKLTAKTRGPEAARKYAEELAQLRPNSPTAQALVRAVGGRTAPAPAAARD